LTRSKEPTVCEQTPPDLAPVPSTTAGADFFLVLDSAGSIREISPSVVRFLSYRRSQLLGTSLAEILHPDDIPVLSALLATGRENPEQPVQTQLRARHADGSWRSFGVWARTVPGPNHSSLLVVEACNQGASQPALTSGPPAMQLGGQFAQHADRASPGEDNLSDEALGPDLIERAGARGETVLVALDDRRVSASVCGTMRQLGYNVLEATSPADAEGFAHVHRDAIHLLVTDLATPRVRGRAFVQSMQAIRPEMKSLFVSCQRYGSLAERRVFESGARLLHDPFTPEELAHAVRRAIENAND
jgi:PAS domain S-box-containing protein